MKVIITQNSKGFKYSYENSQSNKDGVYYTHRGVFKTERQAIDDMKIYLKGGRYDSYVVEKVNGKLITIDLRK